LTGVPIREYDDNIHQTSFHAISSFGCGALVESGVKKEVAHLHNVSYITNLSDADNTLRG